MTAPLVRRAADRPVTRRPGVETCHAFSFGAHYDPDWTGAGPLVALNEERLEPGSGYDDHRHAGLDVVTVVLAGGVEHTDGLGGRRVLGPGDVGVLRAAAGVVHAERSAGGARFLQSWLVADREGRPSYDVHAYGVRDADGPVDADGVVHADGLVDADGLAVAASGPGGPPAPLALSVAGAVLRVVRLRAGGAVALPAVPSGLLHVTAGDPVLAAGGEPLALGPGDTVVLGGGAGVLSADRRPAHALLWELPAA